MLKWSTSQNDAIYKYYIWVDSRNGRVATEITKRACVPG